jgi:hypothetical protein
MTAHPMLDNVTHGDCVEVMKDMRARSVDLILTDPPYLVNYHDRTGRQVLNDDNADWLDPAFSEMHRVLKDGGACLCFYAWNKIDIFMAAWKKAGFRVVGHVVFPKKYASGARFTEYRHEQAYLLTKGSAAPPRNPPPDVIPWSYTGNRLHPTQKPSPFSTPSSRLSPSRVTRFWIPSAGPARLWSPRATWADITLASNWTKPTKAQPTGA